MKHNYIDRCLIKLRREYSKDEAFALMSNRLKEREIEIGMLKSEIFELKDTLLTLDKEALKEFAKSKESKRMHNIITKYRKDLNHYKKLYFELLAKQLTNPELVG